MKTETFDVMGMTCASCQAAVTRAVDKVDGVENADVFLLSNSMKVTYDPEKTTPKQIEEAVEKAGYEAALQSQTLNESAPVSAKSKWEESREKMRREMKEKKTRLIASLILLLVLMCFSMLPMMGIFPFFMDMEWMMVSAIAQLVLCLFILFWQKDFFIHGFKALIKRSPNMDSLVAVGSGVSFVYGLYGILRMAYGYGIMDHAIIHSSMDALYFESAAMIVTLVSLGKYLEARSKAKTGDALARLVELAPKTALVKRGDVIIEIDADQVISGDMVVVKPGMSLPVDGVVASGTGYVDQAALTGESMPVEKKPGDAVMSASININGSFVYEATRVGQNTTLSQIIRLVEEAGNTKAPIARLADKVSGIFVPVVMGISLLTLVGWLIAGYGIAFALNCAISVLVISCPCALGLATPLAVMVSTGKAAENGILIKSAAVLEVLKSINAVVLDKTGTITNGKPAVVFVDSFTDKTPQQFFTLAAAAESGSDHPLAKAIVEKASQMKLALPAFENFEQISGRGLKAEVDHISILAGNKAFMEEQRVAVGKQALEKLDAAAQQGQTPLLFAFDGKLAGMIGVADTIRQTSRQAIEQMVKRHCEVYMLTGDNEATAKAIAKNLPLTGIIADVLPADKDSVIVRLQQQGKKVAMVGDGINDAPALARADAGIAIGAGTDIAIESADLVLMKDNLMDVVTAMDLSSATVRNIQENLFWAFFYNCLGIPLAMGLLYLPFGLLLNPMVGAAAMSLSSVTVCLNALRLRLFKAKGIAAPDKAEEKENEKEVAWMQSRLQDADVLYEDKARGMENDSFVLELGGMTCPNCVRHVDKALRALSGVQNVQVSLEPQQAFVLLDQTANKDQLEQEAAAAVEKAGYDVLSVKAFVPAEADASDKTKTASDEPAAEKKNRVSQKQKAEEPGGTIMEHTLKIEGMSCQHCAGRVEKALAGVDGVEKASVNLADKSAAVVADGTVTADALKKAVEDAGYDVVSVD